MAGAFNFNWVLYENKGAGPLPAGSIFDVKMARRVIEIMGMTSKVHRDRDFDETEDQALVDAVNIRTANPQTPATKYNWMKISVGFDANNVGQAVLIYHLLYHRIRTGKPDPWSVSVGLSHKVINHPFFFANGSTLGSVNDAAYPYVDLATTLATRIRTDLKTFANPDPAGASFVIYDDIDPVEYRNGLQPGVMASHRRATRIGELGWVFQHNTNIQQNIIAVQGSQFTDLPTMPDTTTTIRGWGRQASPFDPADPQIVVTTLKVK